MNIEGNFTFANQSHCAQHDVLGKTEKNLYRFLYPSLLGLALIGNLANITVYQHPFLRDSSTVRMLMVRSIACLLFVLCLIPNFLFACQHARDLPPQPVERDDQIANFYWHSLKYVLFASNACSTIAVWLTVAVTGEHCFLVVFPVKGRRYSSLFHANLFILFSIPLAVLLHIYNLVSLITVVNSTCDWNSNWTSYYFVQKPDTGNIYPKVYFWLSSSTMHFIPMLLLVVFSFAIYKRLFLDGKFRTNNEQKQCVTRLALATTGCHFIFEFPQTVVFVGAALYGGSIAGWSLQEPITAVANFLSLINAAIPFIVYVSCSKRFRQLSMLFFCHKTRIRRMNSERVRQLNPKRRAELRKIPNIAINYTPLNIEECGNHTASYFMSSSTEKRSPSAEHLDETAATTTAIVHSKSHNGTGQ